ncbi:16S rRNA (uracil(1498)-N(3))-methyltransferase [Nostocoides veronense]
MFLTDPGELDLAVVGTAYTLDGAEGRHAATVKRMRVGERLMLSDGQGRRVTGTVAEATPGELRIDVERVEDEEPPGARLTLVQALAKADRDDAAIEAATEYGVDRVIPWQAERSIVQWRGERAEKARQKWVDTVRAAAKQSRRAWVPEVEDLVDTAGLARRISSACIAYVLHEDAVVPLAGQPIPAVGEVLLIVGPEGGIGESELAKLTAAGAHPVRLGTSVLRSSSAGPAAIAVLSAEDRWR